MVDRKTRIMVLNRLKSRRAIIFALIGAAALLVLVVGIALAILLPRPPDPRTPKIAAAVRATFPTICRTSNYRIIVTTGTQPDTFSVRCDPNPTYLGKDTPVMTINLVTCRITATKSMDLMDDYPELYGMPFLANCPLQ